MRISDWSSDVCSSDLKYGNVSKATVGTIQRQLLTLESQGGDHFFGEPALDIQDMIRTDENGRGYVNIRSEEHTSELQSLMRISYAVFCLKKKNITIFYD